MTHTPATSAATASSPFHHEGNLMIKRDNGQPEVSAVWVSLHRGEIRFVDVREGHELSGPLGAADGVENIPLLQLLSEMEGLDKNAPLILICRSGRRSGLAATTLERAGFAHVASVEGGMLAWNLEVLGNGNIHETEEVANTSNLHDAIYRTNGVAEVSARWVSENIGRFKLVDIREARELRSTGYVAQAEHVPMGALGDAVKDWPKSQPIVFMCASGGRSGQAVMALSNMGYESIASLEGGIYGWRSAGLPTVR